MLINKQFNTLIVEGPDCELKQQFMNKLHDYFEGQYLVVTHGDIFEHVYAEKRHLVPVRHTHGAQVKYVFFDKSDYTVEGEEELSIYRNAVCSLLKDEYDIVHIKWADTLDETVCNVASSINTEFEHEDDSEFNVFNKLYSKGCENYDLKWYVIDNQPYLFNKQIMADYQYHNGSYETYDDKSIPNTLLYSAAYTNTKSLHLKDFMKKKYDVQYPINSKIKYRPDAKEYIKEALKGLTLYTSKSTYIDELVSDCTNEEKERMFTFDKAFGDDYIREISQAKTTVITNCEFAHTEMMTARWYEAVIANCIIFVDADTDPKQKVLKQIYGNNSMYVSLLTVTPDEFVNRVQQILRIPEMQNCIEEILNAQHAWYNRLLNNIDSRKISYLCKR